jgi:RND superfamily putative drug exporter
MLFGRLGALAHRFRWYVIGAWVLAAVLLNLLVPQLDDVIKRDSTSFLPPDSQVMQAYKTLGQKFGGTGNGFAIAVFENRRGLSDADRAFYATVLARLDRARDRVDFYQDYISHPELQNTVLSRDGRAIYLPIALRHVVGTPEGDTDAPWLRALLADGRPADLTTYVTGTTAIISDFQDSIQQSVARTTLITLGLLIVILLAVYRSPVTPVIPLTTIGIALMVVRPVVALLGLHWIKVASFTETFILAIVFGAGTDYCIFLISRFREQMGQGQPMGQALSTTSHRVGEAIASSAATVIMGGLAMSTASVALFSTTGPAIAASVAVTLLAGLTLTPALIAVGGRRFFWPQGFTPPKPSRFWTGASRLITAHPRRVLAFSLAPLLLLAALYPTLRLTYDERGPQPQGNDSIQGLQALDRHYQTGEVLPDYVLVRSDHDLRNTADLLLIDQATRALARVPGVASVRSFTQPSGTRVEQATIPWQVGQVGAGLGQAGGQVAAGQAGVARLGAGAAQLAGGATRAQGAIGSFLDGLAREQAGLGQASGATASAAGGAARLRDGAAQLAAGLTALDAGLQTTDADLARVIAGLRTDPVCTPALDAGCAQAVAYLQQIHDGQASQIEPGLSQAVAGARQIAAGDGALSTGLTRLRDGIAQAQAGIVSLQQGERTFASKLGQLAGGAAAVSGGISQLGAGTGQLQAGLAQAAGYLDGLSRDAAAAGYDAFYVPSDHLDGSDLALARYYYLSPDGTTARLLVLSHDDPFKLAAMNRVPRERQAVVDALAGTRLAGAGVQVAGDAPLNDNLRSLYLRDFGVVTLAVLAGVLLVLVLLLRSLVAPIYLLASVLLSYTASMGFTALFWQGLLHRDAIDWTVPIFTFVMLVAVGADYNIFLMSRVREEVERDPEEGIGRAVRRTGAIITSAGVIFAGTFAAMVTSPVANIAETGFAITFGLLLDTFVVRSFLVPAVAVLLREANWWPGLRLRRHPAGDQEPEPPRLGAAARPQPAR